MDVAIKTTLSPAARAILVASQLGQKTSADLLSDTVSAFVERIPAKLRSEFIDAIDEVLNEDEALLRDTVQKYHPYDVEDVFAQCILEESEQIKNKKRGAVYTPAWLARRITLKASKYWTLLNPDGRPPRVAADLSCGVGSFLSSAGQLFGGETRILGCDIDRRSVTYAHLLSVALKKKWELHCADSLQLMSPQKSMFIEGKRELEQSYDFLIGNPPYVRAGNLDPTYAALLKKNYESISKGNFDLSVAFIESAMKSLTPGGMFSYVVSSKFSQSEYGKLICKKLATDVQVINIEFYGDNQVFKGYTTYVMVLTASKRPAAKKFTLTTFPAGIQRGGAVSAGEEVTVPTERLKSFPWDFTSGEQSELLKALNSPNHPLITDIFGDIFQGIRTGANDVFVATSEQFNSFEKEGLLPFVTGREIDQFKIDIGKLRVIFPYETADFGGAQILDDRFIRGRWPRIWKHLTRNRPLLEERSRDEGVAWYGYSRSQSLMGYRVRKLLVKEMMARSEFAADLKGEVAFGSGYALDATRMTNDELSLWVSILNTPTMEFSLRHAGTQLHSGWFRLLKHHLSRVRLPRLDSKAKQKAEKISKAIYASRNEVKRVGLLSDLDCLVARAFGLNDKQRRVIKDFLCDCHRRSLPTSSKGTPEGEQINAEGEERDKFEPVRLKQYAPLHRDRSDLQRDVTFKDNKKLPVHRWYSFTQGYSAALVGKLIEEFGVNSKNLVLDPFVGCGTTGVVCQQRGIPFIGVDISPLMTWVAFVKTSKFNRAGIEAAISGFDFNKINKNKKLSSPALGIFESYFDQAYSPSILNQVLSLFAQIRKANYEIKIERFFLMALVSLLEEISNIRKHGSHYRYLNKSESIGLQKLNIPILSDATNIGLLLKGRLIEMVRDIKVGEGKQKQGAVRLITGDARSLLLPPNKIDFVITSPPYLNRNNYIAQQKAELSLLELVRTRAEYKNLVRSTLRSHVEAALDSEARSQFPEINKIISGISLAPGNNQKIPHMICGYFDDLAATLANIFRAMKAGGRAAFVVGNTRWGGVVIPVDHILLMLAEKAGFIPERILVTRLKGNSPQQMRTYGRIPVRESIVIFKKP